MEWTKESLLALYQKGVETGHICGGYIGPLSDLASKYFEEELAAVIQAAPPPPSLRIGRYRVEPCGCGHRACRDWHVAPVAAVQGVTLTRSQAIAVAEALEKHDAKAAKVAARRDAKERRWAEREGRS